MFLSSYEQLRLKLKTIDIINMAHLGARAFDEIGGEVVQTTAFVLQISHTNERIGLYCRLISPTCQNGKEKMFLSGDNRFFCRKESFSQIPGSQIAYWLNENALSNFTRCNSLATYIDFCKGMATMDNARFLRAWSEVSINNTCFGARSAQEGMTSNMKWFPYNKGGEYRRWFGNRYYVINWLNDGEELKENIVKVYGGGSYTKEVRNENRYFIEGLTWSTLSTGNISFRYSPFGSLFDSKGSMGFSKNAKDMKYILAYLNSCVVQFYLTILSPTLDYNIRGLNDLPYISYNNPRIPILTEKNIAISKTDWDSFETSWDFKRHPLV